MSLVFNRVRFITDPGGTILIKGVTAKNGVPFPCQVRVYRRDDGSLVSTCISRPNGFYIAFGVPSGNYLVAIDPMKSYNLATQDNVK